MKSIFSNFWFWIVVLLVFVGIIFRDSEFEKDIKSQYSKQKMRMTNVHFSELDHGFEHLKVFADVVDMDDFQNNYIASDVHGFFFDKLVATHTGEITADSASKNPYEAIFWGDVKINTSENERLRTNELKYYISRKEVYTDLPITLWKDSMIITGKQFRFNTQTKEGHLLQDVMIRIWPSASETGKLKTRPPLSKNTHNSAPREPEETTKTAGETLQSPSPLNSTLPELQSVTIPNPSIPLNVLRNLLPIGKNFLNSSDTDNIASQGFRQPLHNEYESLAPILTASFSYQTISIATASQPGAKWIVPPTSESTLATKTQNGHAMAQPPQKERKTRVP